MNNNKIKLENGKKYLNSNEIFKCFKDANDNVKCTTKAVNNRHQRSIQRSIKFIANV